MMAQESDRISIGPLLMLNYDQNEGLSLNWNFHGLKVHQTHNYHCFIFGEDSNKEENSRFFQNYYDCMDQGDIFGAVKRTRHSKTTFQIVWFEKVNSHEIPEDILSNPKFYHDQAQFPEIIHKIFSDTHNRKGIIMINFLIDSCQNTVQIQKLEEKIQPVVSHCRNIFEPTGAVTLNLLYYKMRMPKIDTLFGINVLSRWSKSKQTTAKFIKRYMKSINVSEIRVSIELAKDGQFFGRCELDEWHLKDFNSLEKKLFCHPNTSYSEKMIILKKNDDWILDNEIEVNITVKFINGYTQKCSTFVNLYENLEKMATRTQNLVYNGRFENIEQFGEPILTNMTDKKYFFVLEEEDLQESY